MGVPPDRSGSCLQRRLHRKHTGRNGTLVNVVTKESARVEHRAPLTRARVLQAAVDLADRDGIDALSMRKLGQELGVDAMALYRHVQGKDDLLGGVVEVVV